jgi:hypothetical protein
VLKRLHGADAGKLAINAERAELASGRHCK